MTQKCTPGHKALVLASTLSLLPLGAGMAAPVWAQPETRDAPAPKTEVPPNTEIQSYDIPAGPLNQVLSRFAAEAGLMLSADARLTRGLDSPGLTGEYSIEQALQQLLADSGLKYHFEANTVTLKEQDDTQTGGPLRLDPISVQGWRSTTTKGYRPEVISSATKTDSLIVDVPVSVSVVTAEVIADQNASSVREALRNVPGVEPGPNLANVSVQEEFTVRGFENSFVNVNGVERRSTGPLSVANIESIEVIKGPSSVLTGHVAPGGFINIQTKRPERQAAYELTGRVSQTTTGGGTKGRGVIDATGPVNESGSVLYRFIASAGGGSSFIDSVDQEQYLINPMISFLGSEDDWRVDVDLSYLRNDDTFQFGIPFRNGEPDTRIGRTTFLAFKDNKKVTEDFNAEVRAEYNFTEETRVDTALTYHLNEHLTRAQRSFPDDEVQADDTFGSSLDNLDQESYDIEFETNLIHNIAAGSTDWRLLAGVDLSRSVFKDNDLFFALEEPEIDVLNPSNEARLPLKSDPDLFVLPDGENTTDTLGVYAQAEVWIHDRVKLLGGLRYEDVEFEAGRFGNSSTQEDDEVSPRGAILVKARPTTSVYGSYSKSFQQQSGSNAAGDPFEPTEGDQWEIGLKQEFFDGGLLATVAGFQVTQTNLPVTDPNSQVGSIQIGEVESKGVEVEIKGQIRDQLRLTAGYAYLDNEITVDPLGNQGNHLGNVPEHQASVFALYNVFSGNRNRLAVGGGLFYTGDRFVSENNSVELDNYVTADLTVQYGFRVSENEYQLKLGVKNIFDEEYFEQGATRIAFRGEPRTLFATLTARF